MTMTLEFEFTDIHPWVVNLLVGRPRWRGTVLPIGPERRTTC